MDKNLDAKYASLMEYSCNNKDPEADHKLADNILEDLLREAGFTRTAEVFHGLEKWYA